MTDAIDNMMAAIKAAVISGREMTAVEAKIAAEALHDMTRNTKAMLWVSTGFDAVEDEFHNAAICMRNEEVSA
jgi:hypothetical protein